MRSCFPFAYGACDVISGDVAIFRDTGIFEPHVIAHEFCHRKGYWKELHAQALAYLALVDLRRAVLVQSARRAAPPPPACARGEEARGVQRLAEAAALRPELRQVLARARAAHDRVGRRSRAEGATRTKNEWDTGQKGISDYDVGFTNFLYTFETSTTARQTPPAA